jgi:hypothetical protein
LNYFKFERKAALDAILAGIAGFLYAVSFVIISRNDPVQGALLSALFLTLLGFLAVKVFVRLYLMLKRVDEGWALWAFIFALAGAIGTAIHGGFDLANAINPPATSLPAGVPNPIDPRGLLTFGATGIALITFSWLMGREKLFPQGLRLLGYLSGVLLLILYLGRLIVLNPADPIILYPVLINGFVANPLWYLWLGWYLWKK